VGKRRRGICRGAQGPTARRAHRRHRLTADRSGLARRAGAWGPGGRPPGVQCARDELPPALTASWPPGPTCLRRWLLRRGSPMTLQAREQDCFCLSREGGFDSPQFIALAKVQPRNNRRHEPDRDGPRPFVRPSQSDRAAYGSDWWARRASACVHGPGLAIQQTAAPATGRDHV
jgi:hypothetical protein